MIQKKVRVKKSNAEAVATFVFENGITVIMSWLEEQMFDEWLILILAVPDDKLDFLNAQSYIKK